MLTSSVLIRVSAVIVCFASSTLCRAQCADWKTGFGSPGPEGPVHALAVFDDGAGPALYMGGDFDAVDGLIANNIAKWDGSSWSTLGSGAAGVTPVIRVMDLVTFDDGNGTALYAAGSFTSIGGVSANNVAKWDGASWSPLGSGANASVSALAVYDDGSGLALYAGGSFTTAGGVIANRVAKWNGSSWSALGSGSPYVNVTTMTAFDDGTGAVLCIGTAAIDTIGKGSYYSAVSKWNGSSWTGMGAFHGYDSGGISELTVCDLGSGPELFVGGSFQGLATYSYVAKFAGAGWVPLGSGVGENVTALCSFDDGSGTALYAAGRFANAGGASTKGIAKWNGSAWTPLGAGVGATWLDYPYELAAWDDGSGPSLVAGGNFTIAGGNAANNLASWNGSAWHQLGEDVAGMQSDVRALAVLHDGPDPALYAGGTFTHAGSTLANRVAQWNGTSWAALGGGVDGTVHAVAEFDDGSGPAVYFGGEFTTAGGAPAARIAKWNGTSWSPLGTGANSTVYALVALDDVLFAGGNFSSVGGVAASGVARWNGVIWAPLGSGANGQVRGLAVYDDGNGPALYACGVFLSAGGVTGTRRVARWNGSSWSAVGNGADSTVFTIAAGADSAGSGLYIGGQFSVVTGVSAPNVAKWNGSSWSALGTSVNDWVYALTTLDDASGPALYAGGEFTLAGGASASHVAKWNGSSWSAMGGGVNDFVYALAAFDDQSDGMTDLYAGGKFVRADGEGAAYVAEWLGCEPGTGYCFGDGIDALVTADCPCANFGDPGHGCANSNASLGGARLYASGSTNPNTVLLNCTGIPNNNLCTFLRGSLDTPSGVVFGDGVKCASGTIIRFGQQMSGQGGNPSNTVSVAPTTVAPGNTRYYMLQYRNPAPAFCPPETFNASNGYRISW